MEWQGGNKQRPNYWQWRRSFILGDSNWKFVQVGYTVDMYLSSDWMLSRLRSVKLFFSFFFSKCFEQSTSWCFGSHFFVARSHRFIAICHCRFLASFFFFFFFFWNEKHGKKTPLSTFHCNQLQHTRSACFKTDLPDYFDSVSFKSLLSHVGQLSCCDVTEVTWPKRGIFSCRRRRC